MTTLAQLIRSGMTLKEANEYLYQTVKDDACIIEENEVEFTPDEDIEFLDAAWSDVNAALDEDEANASD